MSNDIARAAIPEPFQILGLQLKPLSLGRYRLMQRFGCAFVADEERGAAAEDLILGLLICSMRVDDFLKFIADPKRARREIRHWSRRVCKWPLLGLLPFGLGRWWRKHHAFDLAEKMRLFKRYIDEGSVMPKYWEKESNGRARGGHWSHGVEVTLRGDLGWTEEEVNERPLTKALADYLSKAEACGAVELMTEEEIRQIEEAESRGGRLGEPSLPRNEDGQLGEPSLPNQRGEPSLPK